MSYIVLKGFIQTKKGTEDEWKKTITPIPKGMGVYSIDSGIIKVGDGTTSYEDSIQLIDFKKAENTNGLDKLVPAIDPNISIKQILTVSGDEQRFIFRDFDPGKKDAFDNALENKAKNPHTHDYYTNEGFEARVKETIELSKSDDEALGYLTMKQLEKDAKALGYLTMKQLEKDAKGAIIVDNVFMDEYDNTDYIDVPHSTLNTSTAGKVGDVGEDLKLVSTRIFKKGKDTPEANVLLRGDDVGGINESTIIEVSKDNGANYYVAEAEKTSFEGSSVATYSGKCEFDKKFMKNSLPLLDVIDNPEYKPINVLTVDSSLATKAKSDKPLSKEFIDYSVYTSEGYLCTITDIDGDGTKDREITITRVGEGKAYNVVKLIDMKVTDTRADKHYLGTTKIYDNLDTISHVGLLAKGEKILIIGGKKPGDTNVSDIMEYNTNTKELYKVGDIGGGVFYADAIWNKDNEDEFFAYTSGNNYHFKYNLRTQTRTTLATIAGNHQNSVYFEHNGEIYTYGGYVNNAATKMLRKYNKPNNTWSDVGEGPHANGVLRIAHWSYKGETYFIGGNDKDSVVYDRIYKLTKENEWVDLGYVGDSLKVHLLYACVECIGDSAYIMMGHGDSRIFEIDMITLSIEERRKFPKVGSASSCVVGNQIFVHGLYRTTNDMDDSILVFNRNEAIVEPIFNSTIIDESEELSFTDKKECNRILFNNRKPISHENYINIYPENDPDLSNWDGSNYKEEGNSLICYDEEKSIIYALLAYAYDTNSGDKIKGILYKTNLETGVKTKINIFDINQRHSAWCSNLMPSHMALHENKLYILFQAIYIIFDIDNNTTRTKNYYTKRIRSGRSDYVRYDNVPALYIEGTGTKIIGNRLLTIVHDVYSAYSHREDLLGTYYPATTSHIGQAVFDLSGQVYRSLGYVSTFSFTNYGYEGSHGYPIPGGHKQAKRNRPVTNDIYGYYSQHGPKTYIFHIGKSLFHDPSSAITVCDENYTSNKSGNNQYNNYSRYYLKQSGYGYPNNNDFTDADLMYIYGNYIDFYGGILFDNSFSYYHQLEHIAKISPIKPKNLTVLKIKGQYYITNFDLSRSSVANANSFSQTSNGWVRTRLYPLNVVKTGAYDIRHYHHYISYSGYGLANIERFSLKKKWIQGNFIKVYHDNNVVKEIITSLTYSTIYKYSRKAPNTNSDMPFMIIYGKAVFFDFYKKKLHIESTARHNDYTSVSLDMGNWDRDDIRQKWIPQYLSNKIYILGGQSKKTPNKKLISGYINTKDYSFHKIDNFSKYDYSTTIVNNRLIVVGGTQQTSPVSDNKVLIIYNDVIKEIGEIPFYKELTNSFCFYATVNKKTKLCILGGLGKELLDSTTKALPHLVMCELKGTTISNWKIYKNVVPRFYHGDTGASYRSDSNGIIIQYPFFHASQDKIDDIYNNFEMRYRLDSEIEGKFINPTYVEYSRGPFKPQYTQDASNIIDSILHEAGRYLSNRIISYIDGSTDRSIQVLFKQSGEKAGSQTTHGKYSLIYDIHIGGLLGYAELLSNMDDTSLIDIIHSAGTYCEHTKSTYILDSNGNFNRISLANRRGYPYPVELLESPKEIKQNLRKNFQLFCINKTLYLIGGNDAASIRIQKFDTQIKKWEYTNSILNIEKTQGITIRDSIVFVGGFLNKTKTNLIHEYDTIRDRVNIVTSFDSVDYIYVPSILKKGDDTLIITGGYVPNPTENNPNLEKHSDAYKYNHITHKIEKLPSEYKLNTTTAINPIIKDNDYIFLPSSYKHATGTSEDGDPINCTIKISLYSKNVTKEVHPISFTDTSSSNNLILLGYSNYLTKTENNIRNNSIGILNDALISLGGKINSSFNDKAHKVVLTSPNDWIEIHNPPKKLISAKTISIDTDIFVYSGYGESGLPNGLLLKYTKSTDSWNTYNFPSIREYQAGCLFDEDTLIFHGGKNADGSLSNEMIKFTISTGTFTSIPEANDTFGITRQKHAIVKLFDTIVLHGGTDLEDNISSDTWSYHTIEHKWCSLQDSATARYNHTLINANNNILAIAGENESGYIREVEGYNFITNTWEEVNKLPVTRKLTTANDNNGNVYLHDDIGNYIWKMDFSKLPMLTNDFSSKNFTFKGLPKQYYDKTVVFTYEEKNQVIICRGTRAGSNDIGLWRCNMITKEIDHFEPSAQRFGRLAYGNGTGIVDPATETITLFSVGLNLSSANNFVMASEKYNLKTKTKVDGPTLHKSSNMNPTNSGRCVCGKSTVLVGGRNMAAGVSSSMPSGTKYIKHIFVCNEGGIVQNSNKLPKAIMNSICCSIGNDVYIFGGYIFEGDQAALGISGNNNMMEVYRYNISTNTITEIGTITIPRHGGAVAVPINQFQILLHGGQWSDGNHYKRPTNSEIYDLRDNSCKTVTPKISEMLGLPYHYPHTCFNYKGKPYVVDEDNTFHELNFGSNKPLPINNNNGYDELPRKEIVVTHYDKPCERIGGLIGETNTKVVILGGKNGELKLRDIWVYDKIGTQYTKLETEVPFDIAHNPFCQMGNKLYIMKGNVDLVSNEFYEFDLTTYEFKKLKEFVHMSGGMLTSDGAYIYAVFGYNSSGVSNNKGIHKYNKVNNTWEQLYINASLSSASKFGAIVLNNEIHILGGTWRYSSGSCPYTNKSHLVFNLNTKTFIAKNNYPLPITSPILVAHNDKLHCINGISESQSQAYNEHKYWNTTTDTWEELTLSEHRILSDTGYSYKDGIITMFGGGHAKRPTEPHSDLIQYDINDLASISIKQINNTPELNLRASTHCQIGSNVYFFPGLDDKKSYTVEKGFYKLGLDNKELTLLSEEDFTNTMRNGGLVPLQDGSIITLGQSYSDTNIKYYNTTTSAFVSTSVADTKLKYSSYIGIQNTAISYGGYKKKSDNSGYEAVNEVYKYVKDGDTITKSQLNPLPKKLMGHKSVNIDGNGYIFSGRDLTEDSSGVQTSKYSSSVYKHNPMTDTYEELKPINIPLIHFELWVIKPYVYICCGVSPQGTGPLSLNTKLYRYNINTQECEFVMDLGFGKKEFISGYHNGVATLLGRKYALTEEQEALEYGYTEEDISFYTDIDLSKSKTITPKQTIEELEFGHPLNTRISDVYLGKIYAHESTYSGTGFSNEIQVLDPNENSKQKLQNLTHRLKDVSISINNGSIFVSGGKREDGVVSETISQAVLPNGSWTDHNIGIRRHGHLSCIHNNHLLLIGGLKSNGTPSNQITFVDLTDYSKSSKPGPTCIDGTGVLHKDKYYLIDGKTRKDKLTILSNLDASIKQVHKTLPFEVYKPTCTILEDILYIYSGRVGNDYDNRIIKYDINKDTTSVIHIDKKYNRINSSLLVLDNCVHLIGGDKVNPTNELIKFTRFKDFYSLVNIDLKESRRNVTLEGKLENKYYFKELTPDHYATLDSVTNNWIIVVKKDGDNWLFLNRLGEFEKEPLLDSENGFESAVKKAFSLLPDSKKVLLTKSLHNIRKFVIIGEDKNFSLKPIDTKGIIDVEKQTVGSSKIKYRITSDQDMDLYGIRIIIS